MMATITGEWNNSICKINIDKMKLSLTASQLTEVLSILTNVESECVMLQINTDSGKLHINGECVEVQPYSVGNVTIETSKLIVELSKLIIKSYKDK